MNNSMYLSVRSKFLLLSVLPVLILAVCRGGFIVAFKIDTNQAGLKGKDTVHTKNNPELCSVTNYNNLSFCVIIP